MQRLRKNGSISNIETVRLLQDGTGANPGYGKTALTSASAGLIISTICDNEAAPTVYTSAGGTIETITTLGTYAAPTATKCRFKLIDDTNNPGDYEIQFADARYAVANAKMMRVTISGVTGVLPKSFVIQLTATDVDDAVAGGMSMMPADAKKINSDATAAANLATAMHSQTTIGDATAASQTTILNKVGAFAGNAASSIYVALKRARIVS